VTNVVPGVEQLRNRAAHIRAARLLVGIRRTATSKPGLTSVGTRYGQVTTINATTSPTSYTVNVDGTDVVGVVAVSGRQPRLNDWVTLICSGTDWAIVGQPGHDDLTPMGALAYGSRSSPDSAVVSAEAIVSPPNVTVTLRTKRVLRVTFGGLLVGSTSDTTVRLSLRRATGSSAPVLADTRVRLAQEVAGRTNGEVSVTGVARDVLDPGTYTYGLSHAPALGPGTSQVHCGSGYEAFIWAEDVAGA
jgi:hypothetical protein